MLRKISCSLLFLISTNVFSQTNSNQGSPQTLSKNTIISLPHAGLSIPLIQALGQYVMQNYPIVSHYNSASDYWNPSVNVPLVDENGNQYNSMLVARRPTTGVPGESFELTGIIVHNNTLYSSNATLPLIYGFTITSSGQPVLSSLTFSNNNGTYTLSNPGSETGIAATKGGSLGELAAKNYNNYSKVYLPQITTGQKIPAGQTAVVPVIEPDSDYLFSQMVYTPPNGTPEKPYIFNPPHNSAVPIEIEENNLANKSLFVDKTSIMDKTPVENKLETDRFTPPQRTSGPADLTNVQG